MIYINFDKIIKYDRISWLKTNKSLGEFNSKSGGSKRHGK